MNRMTDERLAWWKDQLRTGQLGHNFETLIRDFETERAKVAELEEWKADRIKTFEEWKANIDHADNLVHQITALALEAAEAQLTALREGLEGLIKECMDDSECSVNPTYFALQIQSLLTQTTPSTRSWCGLRERSHEQNDG